MAKNDKIIHVTCDPNMTMEEVVANLQELDKLGLQVEATYFGAKLQAQDITLSSAQHEVSQTLKGRAFNIIAADNVQEWFQLVNEAIQSGEPQQLLAIQRTADIIESIHNTGELEEARAIFLMQNNEYPYDFLIAKWAQDFSGYGEGTCKYLFTGIDHNDHENSAVSHTRD